MKLFDTIKSIDDYYQPKIVFFLIDNDGIYPDLLREIYRLTHFELQNQNKKYEELILILDSSGGQINSAYGIIKSLRAICNKFTVVVPRWAKSAATLICLAADELILTDVAELGPLDPQIRKPGERRPKSVLDEYLALEALRKDTLLTLDLVVPLLLVRTDFDVKEVLGLSADFVARLMNPIYAKIDPFVQGANMRAMDISKKYATRVLKRWSSCRSEIDVEDLVEKITTGYPSHDFVIDYYEAKELNLPVRLASFEEEKLLFPLIQASQKFRFIGTVQPFKDTDDDQTERRIGEVAASYEESCMESVNIEEGEYQDGTKIEI